MHEETRNPYATPEASIEPEAPGDADFGPFPRFSAWWVLLLSVVTLGIYPVYWLWSRSKVVNGHYREFEIDSAFVSTAIAVYVVDWVLTVVTAVTDTLPSGTAPALGLLAFAATLVRWVVLINWSMKLRDRINRIAGAAIGDPRYASRLITFILAIFSIAPVYLAYKINQIKDAA